MEVKKMYKININVEDSGNRDSEVVITITTSHNTEQNVDIINNSTDQIANVLRDYTTIAFYESLIDNLKELSKDYVYTPNGRSYIRRNNK